MASESGSSKSDYDEPEPTCPSEEPSSSSEEGTDEESEQVYGIGEKRKRKSCRDNYFDSRIMHLYDNDGQVSQCPGKLGHRTFKSLLLAQCS